MAHYTMMAKPIRALELRYPMIQFLIMSCINRRSVDIQAWPTCSCHSCNRRTKVSGYCYYMHTLLL